MIRQLLGLVVALAAGACALPGGPQVSQAPATPPASAFAAPKPVVMPTRQVVVVLAASQRPRWERIQAELGAAYRMRYLRKFPLQSIDVMCLVFEAPEDRPLDDVVRRLRSDPRVDDAQPNRTFASLADADPDPDPYSSLQWGGKALGIDHLGRRVTGEGIKVAVIDTGADTQHPELQASIERTQDLVQSEGEPFDADRHGTAVAGIISAMPGNRSGIAGVAPDARLIVLKACRQGDGDKALCLSWTIARAIDAAIIARVRVINLSLSGPADPLIARLIRKADEGGIVVVAAAEAQRISFPASMPEVIGVLASDANGHVDAPVWSKPGGLVAAPGIEVVTTVPGGRYDFLSGSSLSSAHVSGLVALLLELAPASTPGAMRSALVGSARPRPEGTALAPATPRTPDASRALRALTVMDRR